MAKPYENLKEKHSVYSSRVSLFLTAEQCSSMIDKGAKPSTILWSCFISHK